MVSEIKEDFAGKINKIKILAEAAVSKFPHQNNAKI
jgi:hypothetical protein